MMNQTSLQIPPWLRFLPRPVRARIENRPNLIKVLTNTGWLFADRILRMGVGLIVGVWVARYLGPEQFGLLNYAMAFVAIFSAVATLGLDGIVVRDLVKEPENAGVTLGTAFSLQVISGFLACGAAFFAIHFARSEDALPKIMVAILGFIMVFKSTEVIKYWFESQVQSKYTVVVQNSAFLLTALVKIVLILAGAPLLAFVWAAFAEAALAGLALFAIYALIGDNLKDWEFRTHRARELLSDSWPLILSGLAVMVYMRIDQIMLGQMLGDDAVGIYSAAVRVSEVWYFVPVAIVSSVFPSIIKAKKSGTKEYHRLLQALFSTLFALSLSFAIMISFFSQTLIQWLYGKAYFGAGPVLFVHIWAGIFVSMGVASGKWLILEGFQRITFYRTMWGALTNVFLNSILIPFWGPLGAAVATVFSQFMVIFSLYWRSETKTVFIMMANSFLLKGLSLSKGKP